MSNKVEWKQTRGQCQLCNIIDRGVRGYRDGREFSMCVACLAGALVAIIGEDKKLTNIP